MEKKNAFVTTIGFNKNDPDHVRVAELLNSMSRGKAQYIVNAVLAYRNMLQGEIMQPSGGSADYESIRRVVLQILEEEQIRSIKVPTELPKEQETVSEKQEDVLEKFDENALDGIMASIAAFRE